MEEKHHKTNEAIKRKKEKMEKHEKSGRKKAPSPPSPKPAAKIVANPAKKTSKKETPVRKIGEGTTMQSKLRRYMPLWIFLAFMCVACVLGAIVYKYREARVTPKGHWTYGYGQPDL